MFSRPKPGESEADLLRFQNQFLETKASPAVKLVKKADKRRGNVERGIDGRLPLQLSKDVVTLDDFPDVPPPLTPGPPKKSRFKSARVHFDEDPGEQMDHNDQHITAVLSKIIEHDTSTAKVTMPLFTGDPFPQVFHRSEIKTEAKSGPEKKSIFAQKMAAKKAAEGAWTPFLAAEQSNAGQATSGDAVGSIQSQLPRIVTGEGLGSLTGEQEAQNIHKENLERLQSMSKEQILEEQKQLMAQLDPNLLVFLKSRYGTCTIKEGERKSERERPTRLTEPQTLFVSQPEAAEALTATFLQEPNMEEEPGMEDSPRSEASMRTDAAEDNDLPLKPQKEWVHMNNVEFEKLEWMKDLPLLRQRKTRKGMQARFSLKGELIPPDKEFPTHMGLHHHGEEAERAGYSLQELFHLSRSQVIQQRTLALQVLGHVVQKAKAGEFASLLKGSVLQVLLDAGFLFLLRFSLDDPVDNVMAATVHALHALLVSLDDEEYLDKAFAWYQGMTVYPLIPNSGEEELEEEEEGDEPTPNQKPPERKSKDENKPDTEVARYDVVKGLLKTKMLHRLRYILEVMRPVPLVVLEILDILIRIARHSTEACVQVLDCPRLVETIVREFLPTQWTPRAAEPGKLLASLHGVPCPTAMKLIRVLACGGRNIAARLLNTFEMKSRLSRFIAEDPKDLSLRMEEAISITTEAFRLWGVATGYGQACDLYRDLYPVLMKIVPSLSQLTSSFQQNKTVFELSVQRAAAVVTLLTQVTQTASCRAELQAQLSRSGPEGGDQIPPPPITWSQVAGFRPVIETNMKNCLREITHKETWQPLLSLTTAYVIYMGVYYSNCSQQPAVNPIDCLEEVEHLTSKVLLPLLSQPAMQALWEMLRPCSALCNPLSCSPGPGSVPSIVSLNYSGNKTSASLVGSKSPFPFLTAFLVLVNSILHVHKGLVSQYVSILEMKGLKDYLLQCCTMVPFSLTPSSIWLLHHEYHLQYFVLSLAQKMADACPDYNQHASLHHSVAMTLLSRLLPGSEHLAHELLRALAFNPQLIPEGKVGGPEAADFSDLLRLNSKAKPSPLSLTAPISPLPSYGALLEEAYRQLPLIQSCFLFHFTYLKPALIHSRDVYQGRTHRVQSMLLPEVRGPILPSDWLFLPLIGLYNKATGAETQWATESRLPLDLVNIMTRNLQWILLLETWRAKVLQGIPIAAKLARLMCVFLTGSDLFLEGPVHCYTAALLSLYCQSKVFESLNLDVPLPGLASFHDLYISFLEQFESVSFGDPLFGVFVLLPLQRHFSVQLKMAVFGEHVNTLRALGVPLQQFPLPLERYLSPPEDNLNLLSQYFHALVTGTLQHHWCPILYVVAVAHVNTFIFSQENVPQEIDVARRSMLQRTWALRNEGLKRHLLYYKRADKENPLGFDLYEELPAIRLNYLQAITKKECSEGTSVSDR
ncbi:RNA polymerase II-associated protein 1 isoform X1 [Python bivittatus]|uniref:RNA polymerase II-associated protein 1 isoform X1 n=1 Tax=Python bivittatus TaxID=176946 RepID=A0A9F5J237_PYTBI|nr:RNA polymerase II-associated protein 1 isoform X1 [Python bivittatus]